MDFWYDIDAKLYPPQSKSYTPEVYKSWIPKEVTSLKGKACLPTHHFSRRFTVHFWGQIACFIRHLCFGSEFWIPRRFRRLFGLRVTSWEQFPAGTFEKTPHLIQTFLQPRAQLGWFIVLGGRKQKGTTKLMVFTTKKYCWEWPAPTYEQLAPELNNKGCFPWTSHL